MSRTGRIVAVCIGEGGIPKQPVESARVTPDGLEGDKHRYDFHGGRDRALCLFSVEDYRSLEADGVETTGPGTFGENLLTEGLDFAQLRPGDRLTIDTEGVGLELRLFDIREPCATVKAVDPRLPDLMVGRSGFVARVSGTAEIAVDQPIRADR